MSISKRLVVRATFWAILETGGAQASTFLFYVVFARILTPQEFGVYALAVAIVGTVNMVLFQGFGDALIQANELEEGYVSTAFWTNMGLALCLILLLQAVAFVAPAIFAAPMLGPVIALMSLVCIPRALVSVHSALFRRSLDLRVFAIRTTVGSVVGGLVGIALALEGWGVWALVISQFIQASVIVIIMWSMSDWRPRFVFSPRAFWKLVHFGKHFMAASIITSSIDDVGAIVIGLFLDVTAIGYFSLALRILRSIIELTVAPLRLVMMPALSRVAEDLEKLGRSYSEMTISAAVVWVPVVAGLGLIAPQLIPDVFGAHWMGAVPVVQAMCFAAWSMPLWVFSGQALSAVGRPDAFARIAVWRLVCYCAVFPAASLGGIVAVGWGWSGLSALMVPVALASLRKHCQLSLLPLLGRYMRVIAAGLLMVLTVLIAGALLPAGNWRMIAEIGVGAIAYATALEILVLPGYVARLLVLARGTFLEVRS